MKLDRTFDKHKMLDISLWWLAGSVKDLYAGLAKMCGLVTDEPEKVLLLVEAYDGRVRTKFTDLKEALADAFRGNIAIVAYKYPSAHCGPLSGGKEMHVFQR